MTNTRTLIAVMPLALLPALGCGVGGDPVGPAPAQPTDGTATAAMTADDPPLGDGVLPKIREGEVTSDRPEVGRISGCTATLVAPDVAITASHCLGYRSATRRGRYDTFRIDDPAGDSHSYTVERYRSFGRELGANDIALLGLAQMVPPEVALPAPIAADTPADGTTLSVWGYGCTRIGGGLDGQKRFAEFEQGRTAYHLCPGDSGGPVFNDETGEVLRINSGYMMDRGRSDIYGIVPGLYDDLLEQIEAWTEGEIPERGVLPDGVDPDTEICGRNVAERQTWTCTPGRTHRYRCLAGGAPTWNPCAGGCLSSPRGHADTCAPAAPDDPADAPADRCGDAFRRFAQWSCATDDATLLRCTPDGLELEVCGGGCTAAPDMADRCEGD